MVERYRQKSKDQSAKSTEKFSWDFTQLETADTEWSAAVIVNSSAVIANAAAASSRLSNSTSKSRHGSYLRQSHAPH
ncbi:hypothetical protein Q9L58_008921 [Maublancomyces gigas]|uniref:Uncharacterized protein n=1 Tax=Discina gigas TaxID=1032678 RepID=A0ABR3G8E2_9PEZI